MVSQRTGRSRISDSPSTFISHRNMSRPADRMTPHEVSMLGHSQVSVSSNLPPTEISLSLPPRLQVLRVQEKPVLRRDSISHFRCGAETHMLLNLTFCPKN